jgi:hypothetical protein
MTVTELIELLKQQPPDAEVWVSTDHCGCFRPADVVRRDERGVVVVEESGWPQEVTP